MKWPWIRRSQVEDRLLEWLESGREWEERTKEKVPGANLSAQDGALMAMTASACARIIGDSPNYVEVLREAEQTIDQLRDEIARMRRADDE